MKLLVQVVASLLFVMTLTVVGQNLVLIGGNLRDDNTDVWNKIIELAGGKSAAKIGVVSASRFSTVEGDKVIDTLTRIYRVESVRAIPVTEYGANDSTIADLVQQQTGIFIVEDTDEERSWNFNDWIMSLVRPRDKPPAGIVCYESPSHKRQYLIDTLRPSGVDSHVLASIRKVLNRGGMVAGNAAFMSKSAVILEGDSISALTTGTRFISFPRVPLSVRKEGGLALIDVDVVLETHLSEKGREVRLMRTLLDNEISRGLGIDENTVLVVNDPLSTRPVAKVVTASGAVSGVFYTDVSDIPTPSITNALYENVIFSFFTVNDTLDLNSGIVTYESWKKSIAGEEWFQNAIPSDDILSRVGPAQWRQTARRLIDCKETNVTNYSPSSIVPLVPGVQVIFDRTKAVGFGADLPGDINSTYVASFRNMLATVKVLGIL